MEKGKSQLYILSNQQCHAAEKIVAHPVAMWSTSMQPVLDATCLAEATQSLGTVKNSPQSAGHLLRSWDSHQNCLEYFLSASV